MKKVLFIVLSLVLVTVFAVSCAAPAAVPSPDSPASDAPASDVPVSEAPASDAPAPEAPASGGYKIGATIQDLSNPIWAQNMQTLQNYAKADGNELTYVSCDSNIVTQIEQLENFIESGVDAIIVHPADPAGVEATLKKAREKGIKVFSWDDNLENCDVAWIIDNHALGYEVGTLAANFINEKLGGEAEVAVLDYPQLPILLERGTGITDAIKELAPKAKIVAQSSAINAQEGITKMETIFQSNPNVKVVACIGGGGAVGANEAAKLANKVADDFGIFAADATSQELEAIFKNEGNKGSVMITGGPPVMAKEVYDYTLKLCNGEEVPKEVLRDFFGITKENINEYWPENQ